MMKLGRVVCCVLLQVVLTWRESSGECEEDDDTCVVRPSCWDVVERGELDHNSLLWQDCSNREAEFRLALSMGECTGIPYSRFAADVPQKVAISQDLSVVDFYLDFLVEGVPTLADERSQQDRSIMPELTQCIREKAFGLVYRHDIESKCPIVNSIPAPRFLMNPQVEIPAALLAPLEGYVYDPSISDLGLHQIVHLLIGKLDILLCNMRVVAQLLKPSVSRSEGISFRATAFKTAHVKKHFVPEARSKCTQVQLEAGQMLLIPQSMVLTFQAKEPSFLSVHGVIDELNRNWVGELVQIRKLVEPETDFSWQDSLTKRLPNDLHFSSLAFMLDSLPKETFKDWQEYTRLQSMSLQAQLSAPRLSLTSTSTHTALFQVQAQQVSEQTPTVELLYRTKDAAELVTSFREQFALEVVCTLPDLVSTKVVPAKSYAESLLDSPLEVSVEGLVPDTEYVVMARMVTSHFHMPSPWSDSIVIKTAAL